MKAGSWGSVILIYLYGVFGSASLSKMIPLQADFTRYFAASPGQFALLIALLSIPPALFATIGGSIVDRVGSRSTLIVASLAGAVANLLYLFADSLRAFELIRVFEGCVMIGVFSSAPALIMATTSPERRGKAMAFWSTYTPVGISTGLILASYFAGSPQWRGGFAIHCAVFVLLAALGLLLPRPAPMPAAARPSLLSTYTQTGPLRVALTFAALVIMGFGTSTVFTAWYAQTHGVAVATAAGILAIANLSMIVGGLVTGALLGRGLDAHRLFLILALVCIAAGIGIYLPTVGSSVTIIALVLWLLGSGAATAVVSSTLPKVVSNPLQGAAAAGLLSQMAAIATFITPQLWLPILASGRWPLFVAIIVVMWAAAVLLLPGKAAPPSAA